MEDQKQIIASCAYTRYDFELKGKDKNETHSLSNNVVVDIISPKIELITSIISPLEINQDCLTFKLVIANEGNIEVSGVEVSNPLNEYLDFKEGSLTIDGKPTEYNIFKGFNIDKIKPEERIIITYETLIKRDTPLFKISNLSTIKYDYKLNNIVISETKVSNTVYADILVERMTILKSCNKTEVYGGDTITITTVISNLGNTPLHEVKVEEFGNNNYSVVENSLFINGIQQPGVSPDLVVIPTIKEDSQIIISYDIKTPKPPVKNDEITIESVLSYTSDTGSKSITSNKLLINIKYAYLTVSKNVDKLKVRSGEQLTYYIEIKNVGNIKASNVFFNDIIAEGMRFINGSVKVNDVNKNELNPTVGFFLDDIEKNETVKITYQVDIII